MPLDPIERALKERQRKEFYALMAQGLSQGHAARRVRISRQSASRWQKERSTWEAKRWLEERAAEKVPAEDPVELATPIERRCRQCGSTAVRRGTGRGRPPEFCQPCREKRKQGAVALLCEVCGKPNPFPDKDPWTDYGDALCVPCAAKDAHLETDPDERRENTAYYAQFGIKVTP